MRARPDGELEHPDLSGSSAGAVLTKLYDAHARSLHGYLARRLDSATADDLVAETFLTAWRQRDGYDPARASARAWLFGIATNLARRHARAEVRALRAVTREGTRAGTPEPPDVVAAERADAGEQVRRVAGVIAELRPQERDVLLLVAWADLTPAEAATALGIHAHTARTRLHRARTTLRRHLVISEDDRA
ncbi:RNA polymerase sigma factor [Amycolatopsis cihanbeyliensis]|uniref:RNA polymerase sigma-70 factor (ECF subfamily) n=1 Tax=Amycolatopsis cihanbeyliensis TaxID=1128664 RepID=A0A542DNN4_AMYCI|nr:sigma-70 family RNA polymerase sigma factor [Amycolatopsis cihanbeyliensis]TQJ04584.1 RNA polymerase sigma-70 factor (ECF subfamily) [Amycolatopsis cihanbeyliensis]